MKFQNIIGISCLLIVIGWIGYSVYDAFDNDDAFMIINNASTETITYSLGSELCAGGSIENHCVVGEKLNPGQERVIKINQPLEESTIYYDVRFSDGKETRNFFAIKRKEKKHFVISRKMLE